MIKQKGKTIDDLKIQGVQDAPDSLCQVENITGVQDDQNESDNQDNSLDVFRNKIDFLVQDFIEREYPNTPDSELKNCKGFFDRLILYIYNSYLKTLLHTPKLTKSGTISKMVYYDINQLDKLFMLYTELVYKYKANNRPTILQFCILCGINRDTINNWVNGYENGQVINPDRQRIVQKWLNICESSLVDGSGEYVKEIFLLKSMYNYSDSSNELVVKHEILPTLTPDQIPAVLGIGQNS